jgi:hypothetical protein
MSDFTEPVSFGLRAMSVALEDSQWGVLAGWLAVAIGLVKVYWPWIRGAGRFAGNITVAAYHRMFPPVPLPEPPPVPSEICQGVLDALDDPRAMADEKSREILTEDLCFSFSPSGFLEKILCVKDKWDVFPSLTTLEIQEIREKIETTRDRIAKRDGETRRQQTLARMPRRTPGVQPPMSATVSTSPLAQRCYIG